MEENNTNSDPSGMGDMAKLFGMFVGANPDIIAGLKNIGNLDDAKNKMDKAIKAWSGLEQIKVNAEALNWAVRTKFETLSTVSALAATLLIVATFNDKLLFLDNTVRFLLSILLFIIPFSLWSLYYETRQAAKESIEKIYAILEKNVDAETADRVRGIKTGSFRGIFPAAIYAVLTVVVLTIVVLIWK